MERLTEKLHDENAILLRVGGDAEWKLTIDRKNNIIFLYGKCADKLAAYEDIGLTPEQVQEHIDSSLDAIEMCKVKIALDKLKEYQELEEQGLLYRKVYYIGAECYHPSDCNGLCEYCDCSELEVKSEIIRLCDIEIGKHFFTESDAEQALQDRK